MTINFEHISELNFFVTQKLCKNIPQIIKDNSLKTAKVYGLQHVFQNKEDHERYDGNWVYTTAVGVDASRYLLLHQTDATECILRIEKDILINPNVVKQMMINNHWARGKFIPTPMTEKHHQRDITYETLFFGGDETVFAELQYPGNTSKEAFEDGLTSSAKFTGDITSLEEAINHCLGPDEDCEIMFRHEVDISLITGYYEVTQSDVDVGGLDVDNIPEWKPLNQYQKSGMKGGRRLLHSKGNGSRQKITIGFAILFIMIVSVALQGAFIHQY